MSMIHLHNEIEQNLLGFGTLLIWTEIFNFINHVFIAENVLDLVQGLLGSGSRDTELDAHMYKTLNESQFHVKGNVTMSLRSL